MACRRLEPRRKIWTLADTKISGKTAVLIRSRRVVHYQHCSRWTEREYKYHRGECV